MFCCHISKKLSYDLFSAIHLHMTIYLRKGTARLQQYILYIPYNTYIHQNKFFAVLSEDRTIPKRRMKN